jgi:hypothetical protein
MWVFYGESDTSSNTDDKSRSPKYSRSTWEEVIRQLCIGQAACGAKLVYPHGIV